jgi:hypothetical protein
MAFILTLIPLVGVHAADDGDADPSGVDEAIVLELPPFASPPLAKAQFGPLTVFLAEALGRPVEIVVSKSHRSFVDRAGRHDDRLVVAPRHLAAYLADRKRYVPVAYFGEDTHLVVYVRSDIEGDGIEVLRGRQLSLPDPLSLHAVAGLRLLRSVDIVPGRDLRVVYHPFHDAALFDVVERRSDAVITAPIVVEMLAPKLRGLVRPVATLPDAAGIVLLVGPTLPSDIVLTLGALFPPDPGAAAGRASGQGGPASRSLDSRSTSQEPEAVTSRFHQLPAGERAAWPQLAQLVESALVALADDSRPLESEAEESKEG